MSSIRKRVVVHGRVQGVFFRDSTQREARGNGVGGWVRNREDGAVEAAFEGEPQAVEAMLEFVRNGPGSADVARVEVFDEEPEGASSFAVSG